MGDGNGGKIQQKERQENIRRKLASGDEDMGKIAKDLMQSLALFARLS
ncbi:hypothetical protein [Laspinema palackyanum]|nr:hypothetical protein [Laspinema sp. D2c]